MSVFKFITLTTLGFGLGEIVGAMRNRWAYLNTIDSTGPFMLESIKTRDSTWYGNYKTRRVNIKCVKCGRIFPPADTASNYQTRATFCHRCGFKYRLLY